MGVDEANAVISTRSRSPRIRRISFQDLRLGNDSRVAEPELRAEELRNGQS